MKLTVDDYQPLGMNRLAWRWDREHNPDIDASEVACIHSLTPRKAREAWEISLRFVDASDTCFRPRGDLFAPIFELSVAHLDTDAVRDWLTQHVPETQSLVLVSWQPDDSMVTSREIVIKFWDDFCYPSSDDVSIWPLTEQWVVHYHHDKRFFVGVRKK